MTRISAFGVLWIALAAAYVAASVSGRLELALSAMALLVGAAIAMRHPVTGLVVGMALAAAAFRWGDRVPLLAYLPPLAAFAFMAFFFGRTLGPGRVPFIVRIARMEHPQLPPAMERHAARLTVAWTACFALLLLASIGLAFFLPFPSWSRWVNGLGYGVPGAFFVGELAYRNRRFADVPHGSLAHLTRNVVIAIREDARASRPAATGRG